MSFAEFSGGRNSRVPLRRDFPSGPSFESVTAKIQRFAENVAQIKQSVDKIGTSRDSQQLRETMNRKIGETQQQAKEIPRELKDLEASFGQDDFERKSNRKKQKKLTEDFRNQMETFKKIANMAVRKEKEYSLSPVSTFSQEQEETPSYFRRDDEEREVFQQKQMEFGNQISVHEVTIEDRAQGIRELEKNIQDMNEIMIDISNLVSDQGEMIDNIESNISVSASNVSKGTLEIQKASNYQRKTRTKLCCLLLLILIIVSVGVLVTLILTKAL